MEPVSAPSGPPGGHPADPAGRELGERRGGAWSSTVTVIVPWRISL